MACRRLGQSGSLGLRFALPAPSPVGDFGMSRKKPEGSGSNGEVPELLTAKQLEKLFNISVKTIYNYVGRELMPYVRIQSNVRFRKEEISEWIEGQSYRP